MTPPEITSDVIEQALKEERQGSVEEPSTNPEETSEGKPETEEQETPEAQNEEEDLEKLLARPEVEQLIYRRAQSMKDKELYRERLQRQQQQEQERIRKMSDAQYGKYQRQQEALQAQTQEVLKSTLAQVFDRAQEQALAFIEDDEARAAVKQKCDANAFETFPEFLEAVVKAQSNAKIEKTVSRKTKALEKTLRESIRKELLAEQEEEPTPELGGGLPTSRREKLHGEAAIADGLSDLRKKSKRK